MMKIPLVSSVYPGLYALVDDQDFELVRGYVWHPHKDRNALYAVRNLTTHGTTSMHRMICGLSKGDGKVIDHRDHDGLNNQRSNLRVCTHAENMRNRKISVTNKTGFKGVFARGKKFRAMVCYEGVIYRMGSFEDPQSAYDAYLKKSRELHGEFAHG